MTRTALALGVLLGLMASAPAHASDTFRIGASGDQYWGPQTGRLDPTESPQQLEASGTMADASGSADYAVQAGPGIARVSLNGHVASGAGSPFDPSLQAVATTELTVDGPESEINTSL